MRRAFFIIFVICTVTGCAAPQKRIIEETIFYPPLPQTPRIQFLTSLSSEEDLGKKQSLFEEFLLGDLPPLKRLQRPYDIGSAKNKLYVMDRESRTLIIIDLEKMTFDYLKTGSSRYSFADPSGIWVSRDNFKYVTDFKRKHVEVFDNNDKFVRTYGKGILDKPLDVTVYDNNVYVCDFNLHQIIVFDALTGEAVRRIGEVGKKEGQLFKPTHVTVDKDGNLYVTDAFNFRIQKFDPDGNYMMKYGYHGDTVGGFARPKGLAIDEEDHLYVVDTAFENVQIFDANTEDTLLYFGGYGVNPGEMFMPSAIHIDYENVEYFSQHADKNFNVKYLIYVGNQYGLHKINVYGFGKWIGEPLPKF